MTDQLTPDELRAACEAAGMGILAGEELGSSFAVGIGEVGAMWADIPEDREWIESRCASLLVARVREMDPEPGIAKGIGNPQRRLHEAYCRQFAGLPPGYMVATDAHRIRAAMEVIREK